MGELPNLHHTYLPWVELQDAELWAQLNTPFQIPSPPLISAFCVSNPPIAWSRSPFQILERDPRPVSNIETRSFQAMTKVRKEESSGGMRMKCKVIRGNRRGF